MEMPSTSASLENKLRAEFLAHPEWPGPAAALADFLATHGNAEEALRITERFTHAGIATLEIWTARGLAFKLIGNLHDAIEAYQRGMASAPQSGIAEHNLAAALGDAQRFEASESAARRAIAKGVDAAETYLVLGRSLTGLGRFDEAATAFRAAILRRPDYFEAHADLALLLWMQTEDIGLASAALDAAIRAFPNAHMLCATKARLLDHAGDPDGAISTLMPLTSLRGIDPEVMLRASELLTRRDPEMALELAVRAAEQLPDNATAISKLAEALLACGKPEEASRTAHRLLGFAPLEQYGMALVATAWRILGDRRYQELYNYDQLVKEWTIDVPSGWATLDDFLRDLKSSLERLHPMRGHPLNQSLRHGTQTLQGLDKVDDPVIRAFFSAIDGPIRRHIAFLEAGLGKYRDPVRARLTGGYKFNGVWSARLRSSGYHTDHVHPMGWLSSAFYVALPDAVDRGREGWIKFGQPGVATSPALEAEHYVKPEPGKLVLFPSYMWHGTVPFHADQERLTIAFDLVPD